MFESKKGPKLFSRKNGNQSGQAVQDQWTKKLNQLLQDVYRAECHRDDKKIQVHAEKFPNELVIIVSIIDSKEDATSFFISIDLNEKKELTDFSDNVINAFGILLDDLFSSSAWDSYQLNWAKESLKKLDFYYKVTRENVFLTIEANKILGQH